MKIYTCFTGQAPAGRAHSILRGSSFFSLFSPVSSMI